MFVQEVETPALAIMVPLLERGLRLRAELVDLVVELLAVLVGGVLQLVRELLALLVGVLLGLVGPLLRLLLEQLRQGNKRVRPRESTVTACLRPLTPQARKALGQESLLIQSFPFRIGRRSDDRLAFNELQLDDSRPYQISRHHLLLSLEQGVLTVQDRGSSLGTWVRGQLLGGASSFEGPVLVHDGSVELVLGHTHSPMRFQLEVLPLTDPDAGG